MMPHLMGNNVGIREVAVGAKLSLHRGKEAKVDVKLLVARTVERSDCC
jgi:hypothetical protein